MLWYLHRACLLVLCLNLTVVVINPAVAGQIYKWVDANGRTHFGDSPPNTLQPAQKITAPTVPGVDAEADAVRRRDKQQKLLNAFKMDRLERQQKRDHEHQVAADVAKKCADIRHNLTQLNRSNLLYKKDKNGNKTYVSGAVREKLITQLQTLLESHCS